MNELERLKKTTFLSLNQQNGVITQLNDMILDNQQAIKLLSTKILQTDEKVNSLKTYLDRDIKKDIDSIMNKQLEKLDLNKSIKTMSSSVANMYAGLRKKKRKTKRRKRKRRRTRKKS